MFDFFNPKKVGTSKYLPEVDGTRTTLLFWKKAIEESNWK